MGEGKDVGKGRVKWMNRDIVYGNSRSTASNPDVALTITSRFQIQIFQWCKCIEDRNWWVAVHSGHRIHHLKLIQSPGQLVARNVMQWVDEHDIVQGSLVCRNSSEKAQMLHHQHAMHPS